MFLFFHQRWGLMPFMAITLARGVTAGAEDDFVEKAPENVGFRGIVLDETFDRWMFGGNGGTYRQQINDQIGAKVHELTVKYGFNDAQQTRVEGAIRNVERHIVLRIPQHEALVELLLREIRPPKTGGDFDDIVVKYQFSRLPEDALKPIFDEDQWPRVRIVFDGFQEFGPVLIHHRLIADEPAETTAPEKENANPHGDLSGENVRSGLRPARDARHEPTVSTVGHERH